jgi:predicted Rdx family selenoprotein
VHFVIHYGLATDFEDEALALARGLFAYFDEAIDSLALIPVGEAEFDLFLNGCLIHSYRQSGRVPRLSDSLAARLQERTALRAGHRD